MTNQELLRLTRHEAKALRRNATSEQRGRLNFQTLEAKDSYNCVYGQMTGSCWSGEAERLIKKCASRVYPSHQIDIVTYGEGEIKANGEPSSNRNKYYSPIEIFISSKNNQINGNNRKLLEYIKGETDELNLI
jgi:hypothetical protein